MVLARAIFIGSEDIREQLPEDAKRFDGIDASFKEQMSDASQTPSRSTRASRTGATISPCLAAIELCNRSLSVTETKRKKFPRFYFISRMPRRALLWSKSPRRCRSASPSSPTTSTRSCG